MTPLLNASRTLQDIDFISSEGWMIIIILLIVLLFILVRNLHIVPQARVFVVERLGAYRKTWTTGLHVKVPFIERVAARVSLKEKVADFEPQAVITKDNVTIQIDTVVFYQITDPVLFTYGIEEPILAIENLSATTLRNIIGDLELDQTLTSRDVINTRMRVILDEATDPWGIKVNRVELKNILPPADVTNAMEKQVKAERERRESILRAEGEKESAILVAEGLRQAMILEADANREREIREAEGEAEAIRMRAQARAEGLAFIKDVEADKATIALRSLEALESVADGRSTKIIIPSEVQNLAGLVTSLHELTTDPEDMGDELKNISEAPKAKPAPRPRPTPRPKPDRNDPDRIDPVGPIKL